MRFFALVFAFRGNRGFPDPVRVLDEDDRVDERFYEQDKVREKERRKMELTVTPPWMMLLLADLSRCGSRRLVLSEEHDDG